MFSFVFTSLQGDIDYLSSKKTIYLGRHIDCANSIIS